MSDPDLAALAAEELAADAALGWAALSRLTPWGDTFEAISPAGRPVLVERSYLWRDGPGGDILLEVVVYPGPTRYDQGARAGRTLKKA